MKRRRKQKYSNYRSFISEKNADDVSISKILVGDFFGYDAIRKQAKLIAVITILAVVYIAMGYQCRKDLIVIDKLQAELKDAKYRAMAVSSELTEQHRESNILRILKERKDTTLRFAIQPPYQIEIPEE